MDNKDLLLREGNEMINKTFKRFNSLGSINLKDLDKSKTMVLVVDINKGFSKSGLLYSKRIEKLIEPIGNLVRFSLSEGIRVLAFTDYHTEDSVELKAYPKHCMSITDEWELVDELNLNGVEIIKKNSTNGFLEEGFILNKEMIDNLIIVGCCTDICIYQLAISLKAEFNRINKEGEIYVSKKLVDTFDTPTHRANFMNYVFLNSMLDNGIKVIEDIILN